LADQSPRSVATVAKCRNRISCAANRPNPRRIGAFRLKCRNCRKCRKGYEREYKPGDRQGRVPTSNAGWELRHSLAHNLIDHPKRPRARKESAQECFEAPCALIGHHPRDGIPPPHHPQFYIPDDPFVIPNATPDSLSGRRTHPSVPVEQWLCQQPSQEPAM
jgi:hypothetical protein